MLPGSEQPYHSITVSLDMAHYTISTLIFVYNIYIVHVQAKNADTIKQANKFNRYSTMFNVAVVHTLLQTPPIPHLITFSLHCIYTD